jgi:hypothetical protein
MTTNEEILEAVLVAIKEIQECRTQVNELSIFMKEEK